MPGRRPRSRRNADQNPAEATPSGDDQIQNDETVATVTDGDPVDDQTPPITDPVVPDPVDDTIFPDDDEDDDPEDDEGTRAQVQGDDDEHPDPAPIPEDRLAPAQVAYLNRKYADSGITFGTNAVEKLIERNADLLAKNRKLRKDAEAGIAYKKDLVEDALTEARRAHPGEARTFAEDQHRAMLERLDIDQIKFWRDRDRKIADARFTNSPDAPDASGTPETPAPRRRGGRRTQLLTHADQ